VSPPLIREHGGSGGSQGNRQRGREKQHEKSSNKVKGGRTGLDTLGLLKK